MLDQSDLFDCGAEGSRPSPHLAPVVEEEVDRYSISRRYRREGDREESCWTL